MNPSMQDDTREQLLESATRLFAAKGFYGASLANIADELGLTKQALLHYFGRKEKLYAEILSRISDRMLGCVEAARDEFGNPEKQLLAALEKFEIKPFESVGKQFNPEIHEAMAQQEHADYADNTIIAQFQKGYMLGERLLRPARVIVSRAPAEDEPESED